MVAGTMTAIQQKMIYFYAAIVLAVSLVLFAGYAYAADVSAVAPADTSPWWSSLVAPFMVLVIAFFGFVTAKINQATNAATKAANVSIATDQKVDDAAVERQVVKAQLAKTTEHLADKVEQTAQARDDKLNHIAAVSQKTMVLSNGRLGAEKKKLALALRRLANLPDATAGDIRAAEDAEAAVRDHLSAELAVANLTVTKDDKP